MRGPRDPGQGPKGPRRGARRILVKDPRDLDEGPDGSWSRTQGTSMRDPRDPVGRARDPGEGPEGSWSGDGAREVCSQFIVSLRKRAPARMEIDEARSGGFYLYHYDAAGRCVADTWHATLTEAKEQARFEFEIEAADWVEVTN
jgi:hypothetical protein